MRDFVAPKEYTEIQETVIPGVYARPISFGLLKEMARYSETEEFKALPEIDQMFYEIDRIICDEDGEKFRNFSTPEELGKQSGKTLAVLVEAARDSLMVKT